MIETVVDVALVTIAVALALWSVLVRATFVSIVGFVAFGLLLMLAWMRLGAPDVAMTEGAIGSGLAGMLLLGAAARLRRPSVSKRGVSKRNTRERTYQRTDTPGSMLGAGRLQITCVAILATLVTVLIASFVLAPVVPSPTLAPEAMAQLPRFGLGNPVNVVLLGFRAIDTLVEKIVLVMALAGVWALARDTDWEGRPRMRLDPVPEPLRFLARVLPPFGIVLAVYLVWHGANEPGGAFPAAALLAAMALLVVIAGVAPVPPTSQWSMRAVVVAGPVVFFLVGLLGIPTAGAFLAYPEGFEIPFIKLIEVLLTTSVAVILVMLIVGPPVSDAADASQVAPRSAARNEPGDQPGDRPGDEPA